jgi:hypothetical protein
MKRLSGKLTYSNVISTLCLVLLVGGGTAYAAKAMLPKNSVGPKQLIKGAVTPAKLSKASKETLSGAAGPTGPTGSQGTTGKEGPPGKEGPQGPGAVTIEDTATATPRVVATIGGVNIVDVCSGGTGTIILEASTGGNTFSYFGTSAANGTIVAGHAENIASHNPAPTTNLELDYVVGNNAVTTALSRFDLHISGSNCEVTGLVIPSAAD